MAYLHNKLQVYETWDNSEQKCVDLSLFVGMNRFLEITGERINIARKMFPKDEDYREVPTPLFIKDPKNLLMFGYGTNLFHMSPISIGINGAKLK